MCVTIMMLAHYHTALSWASRGWIAVEGCLGIRISLWARNGWREVANLKPEAYN